MSEIVDKELWNLPPEYNYYQLSINYKNDHCFGIKEVKDKDSAEEWLKAYSLLSKTTWRVERTYKCSGKFVHFKKDYRCCHFTDRRVRGIRSSKHTGCPAKLCINVKRYIENPNKPNLITKAYPCNISIKNIHNHPITASLKHRDLNIDVKPTLYVDDVGQDQTEFNFSSKRAREEFFYGTETKRPKTGLLLPTSNHALQKNVGAGDCVQISTALENKQTAVKEITEELENIVCDNNVHVSSVHANEDRTVNEFTEELENTEENEAISQLWEIFSRIEKGLQSNPVAFLPAAKKMLKNASTFADTETGLVTAMHTFGAYSGVQNTSQCKCTNNERSHKTIIGVQPTAIYPRIAPLVGKMNISAGRPQGNIKNIAVAPCHIYTVFRCLP